MSKKPDEKKVAGAATKDRRAKGSGTIYWHAATKSWCAMLKKNGKSITAYGKSRNEAFRKLMNKVNSL